MLLRILLLLALLPLGSLWAQPSSDSLHVIEHGHPKVSPSLKQELRAGTFSFHTRSFFMSTLNRGDLLDYSTLATGGGMAYQSPRFRGFSMGLSGFFVFQVYEHNVRIADPSTGNVNRYEILLYDMNDLSNTSDLDRLEDLYLDYQYRGWAFRFGQQEVHSPFLNSQDNRMRHNSFSGITASFTSHKSKMTAAWLQRVNMRGTVDWFRIEDSFGVYPFGRNPLGDPSAYKGMIKSSGVGLLGWQYSPSERSELQFWNYHSDRVFNMSFAQVEGSLDAKAGKWLYGLQGLYQLPVGNGGNSIPEQAYMDPSSRGQAIGTRIGWKDRRSRLLLNTLYIDARGRFLFPREWGREQFFVSLPRERHEGSGGVRAISATYELQLVKDGKEGLHLLWGAALVDNPSIDNFALNKYGVPSYYHFVASADYRFRKYLEGLEVALIITQKTATRPAEVEDIFRINRVDMWNFSAIVNYRF